MEYDRRAAACLFGACDRCKQRVQIPIHDVTPVFATLAGARQDVASLRGTRLPTKPMSIERDLGAQLQADDAVGNVELESVLHERYGDVSSMCSRDCTQRSARPFGKRSGNDRSTAVPLNS